MVKSSSPAIIPITEERLTIAPPPAVRRSGIACFEQRKTLRRFVSRTASHASTRALVDGAVAERAAADAGAVEEHVEPIEGGEERLDLLGLGEVGLLTVEPDHLGARVGERRRDGAADPAGRAGDDCNLP